MTYEEERKELIQKDKEFETFPPPDYSIMTNEDIKLRTKILKSLFVRKDSKDKD